LNASLELSELNRAVGRLFMIGIPGTRLDEDTRLLIRNIEDPVQLARLCRDIQDIAQRYHGDPLFLAVDQEGGRVARLREPFTLFSGNEAMAMDNNPLERAKEFGSITAREMKIVGLNMNLAPVLDVRRGEPEKHLKGRTFGEDHRMVALMGKTVIRSLQENGVMAVAKHFPGLGRADLDPHFRLPRIDLDLREINDVNLPPFRAAIDEGVSGIMSSHAIYPALDDGLPATLSPAILDGLLRKDMGFEGLILTDDLEMGAIKSKWGVAAGALTSFRAGADILLICEGREGFLDGLDLISKEILKGELSMERLNRSNQRIAHARSQFIKTGKRVSLKEVREYFRSKA